MIGAVLSGRYEIVASLGAGGMGSVYRARDPVLGRDVAVKLVAGERLGADGGGRVLHEARLVARMDHPGIVPLHDLGEHDGSLFLVMPVVRGGTLREHLRTSRLRPDEALELAAGIAEALDYSHARGVVHGDLKPENVMVDRDGSGLRARIMDFGLARAAWEGALGRDVSGTVGYLPPERIRGGEPTPAGDLFALGVLLHELLAGRPPDSPGVEERVRLELPFAADLVAECLEPDPLRRPASAATVALRLREIAGSLPGEVPPAAPLELRAAPRAPLVGRVRELAAIDRFLGASAKGECRVLTIAGEPGLGKTRLLEEISRRAVPRGFRVLEARFSERQRGLPFQAFCDLVREACRSRGARSGNLSDLAAELTAVFPALLDLPELRGRSGTSAPRREVTRPEDRGAVFELLARTVSRLAGDSPSVLLLENLHEAEASAEALGYVVRRLSGGAALVVATYRPSEVDRRSAVGRLLDSWNGQPGFERIDLLPFGPDEHRLYVEQLAGGPVSGPLASRLLEASEGNPFFTRELVASATLRGALLPDGSGELDLATGALGGELPETIQQAVETRLEKLPEDLREILTLGSIIGRSFDARDLVALADAPADEMLDRLIADGLLEEERGGRGDRLAFASGVVRDALYSACPRRRRRNLHRRYAELLETRHAGRLERVEALLVHHFAAADVADRTVEYGLRAARRFLSQFAGVEAASMARAALEFLEDDGWEGDPHLVIEARRLLAASLSASGDPAGAFRIAIALVTDLERRSDSADLPAALLEAAELAWSARLVLEARPLLERAVPLLRTGGDRELLARGLRFAAEVAVLRGDYDSARRLAEESEDVPAESAPTPRSRGGRLVVPCGNAVFSLDPSQVAIREQAEVLPCVFETLTRVAGGARAVPWLASEVEPEAGGRRWRFRLREGVHFHDGRRLRARDVRYSFERLLQHGDSQGRRLLSPVVGARALAAGEVGDLAGFRILSSLEFTLELERPVPFLPELLSDCPAAIVPEGTDRFGPADRPAGTGPFRIVRFEPGARLELERYAEYWREGLPLADELSFEFRVPSAEIARRFREGSFSLASDLRPEDLEALRQDPVFAAGYRERPRLSTYWLAFNSHRGPMADPELRRAVAVALEPSALVRRSLGRAVIPARTLIAPGLPGYDDAPIPRTTLAPDGERTTILPSHDVRSGESFHSAELSIAVSPAFVGDGQYSALLREMGPAFARLGWKLVVRNDDTPGLFRELERREADLVLARWAVDYPDADSFAHGVLHSSEGWIGGFVGSEPLDRLVLRARLSPDPSERHALYREVEEFLSREALLVPLFHEQVWRFAHPMVTGLSQLGFLEPTVRYESLYVGKPAE